MPSPGSWSWPGSLVKPSAGTLVKTSAGTLVKPPGGTVADGSWCGPAELVRPPRDEEGEACGREDEHRPVDGPRQLRSRTDKEGEGSPDKPGLADLCVGHDCEEHGEYAEQGHRNRQPGGHHHGDTGYRRQEHDDEQPVEHLVVLGLRVGPEHDVQHVHAPVDMSIPSVVSAGKPEGKMVTPPPEIREVPGAPERGQDGREQGPPLAAGPDR